MTVYALGDTVTLNLTALADATVVLNLTAPNGTESTPATSHVGTTWSASFTANQYDTWQYAWVVTGTASNVELGTVTVGGPWYATLAELRTAVNLAATDTTRDNPLSIALSGASRAVEEYTERDSFLLATTASARIYGLTRNVICNELGERRRVDDIGSLTDLAVELTTDGVTFTTLTGYETYPDNALARGNAIEAILSPSTSLRSYRRLRVTARWGWPAVPAAVHQATLLQAARLYRRKDSPEGVSGSADWGLVRVPNLDPDVKALLAYLTKPLKVA
jgi:hypothetical protein